MTSDNSRAEFRAELGERVFQHLRANAMDPSPRAYEVFFVHFSGENAALSKMVTEQLAGGQRLTAEQIEEIHNRHLALNRFAHQAEKSGNSLLGEMDVVMEMLDLAVGSTRQYGQSLEAISADLKHDVDLQRVREIVVKLVTATRETLATNQTLEARLRETRNEVQDLRETLEAIRTESLIDPLTTLANRKHLDRTLLQAVDHAAVSGESLTVLMIDVDKFKEFNDTWGHLTGDQVLRLVAMSIKGAVRPHDTAGRFGGEEFAIVLPRSTLKGGHLVAERIRQTVMSRELVKRSTGEALGRLTVSIGIASFTSGDTAALLLERADRCLLEAKRTGRNKCVVESEISETYPEVA